MAMLPCGDAYGAQQGAGSSSDQPGDHGGAPAAVAHQQGDKISGSGAAHICTGIQYTGDQRHAPGGFKIVGQHADENKVYAVHTSRSQ